MRRGSRKTPTYKRLTEDCYLLEMFLKGKHDSELESIFSRSHMSNMIDNENIHSKAEIADQQNSNELRMNMSKILANVIDLNKNTQSYKKII
jgi:hypothetical protein